MNDKSGDKITWSQRAVHVIANQMMLGASTGRYAVDSTVEQREAFKEEYRPIIEAIIPHLPRGMSAVGAAVAKCAIMYGLPKATEFASNVKNMMFNGKKDPCYHYHLWLDGKSREKRDKKTIYLVTLTACRAYCCGKELSAIRAATKDLFEWDKEWKPLIGRGRNRQGL